LIAMIFLVHCQRNIRQSLPRIIIQRIGHERLFSLKVLTTYFFKHKQIRNYRRHKTAISSES